MSTFDGSISTLTKAQGTVFVYFFGNELPGTTRSWCPDCVNADQHIRTWVNATGFPLVEARVGDRSMYKNNPQHPYRLHAGIDLKAVPTLIEWTSNGPGRRWVDDECIDIK